MSRRTSRAEQLAEEARQPKFICWVPGCQSYGVPQVQPPGYEPGQHYRQRHMTEGQGKPGTPVVEWEQKTGRRVLGDARRG